MLLNTMALLLLLSVADLRLTVSDLLYAVTHALLLTVAHLRLTVAGLLLAVDILLLAKVGMILFAKIELLQRCLRRLAVASVCRDITRV